MIIRRLGSIEVGNDHPMRVPLALPAHLTVRGKVHLARLGLGGGVKDPSLEVRVNRGLTMGYDQGDNYPNRRGPEARRHSIVRVADN